MDLVLYPDAPTLLQQIVNLLIVYDSTLVFDSWKYLYKVVVAALAVVLDSIV